MTKRAALNVSLTPEVFVFVAAWVASGRDRNDSEIVWAVVRNFEQHHDTADETDARASQIAAQS